MSHDLMLRLGEFEVKAPIGFSERLGVGFNILGQKGILDSSKFISTTIPGK